MRFDKNKLSLTMKLTRDLTAVRVIAMELVRGSCYSRTTCHCETCRIHGVAISLPHGSCHSRWSEKIFPRSLNVSLPRATLVAWWKQSHCKLATISLLLDRRTTFAMTIRTTFAMTTQNLSLRDVQNARRGNLLTSSTLATRFLSWRNV